MKHLSLKSVVDAYRGFQDCMTNKSWGYLALLKSCNSIIKPSTPFEIDLDGVSNFLEDIFNLSESKRTYNGGRSLYVIFSKIWDKYFEEQGRHTPNIYDVAVWAYRRKSFNDDITSEKLISMFAEEFNIPLSVIRNSFDTKEKEVAFAENLYSEVQIKYELKNIGVDVSRENIDAKKGGVVANPGEISRGPFVQTLYAGLEITDYVIILQSKYTTLYGNEIGTLVNKVKPSSLQQIYYGAPGTGKSHSINEQTEGESVIRTTFHPDSDYSTFVGAYKPTTMDVPVTTVIGTKAAIVEGVDGNPMIEKKIVYDFVGQAFFQAYVKAWKFYAENEADPKKQFLVIEEINRGNCAQIFGDLFQLLDRNEWGFSDYPINADKDMKKQLKKALAGLSIADAETINGLYKGRDVVKEVLEGDILLLPSNLYIWATMNTSDQSLFPIDSAFKRRWDWKYIPIKDMKLDYKIRVKSNDGNLYDYDWGEFLAKVNEAINATTNSEDKKLGYFFCKPQKAKTISVERFVSKVLFYLFGDVLRDYDSEEVSFKYNNETFSLLKWKDGDKQGSFRFSDFFDIIGNAKESEVTRFLDNIKITKVLVEDETDNDYDDDSEEDSEVDSSNKKDRSRYSINGTGSYNKRQLAGAILKYYVDLNNTSTADDVYHVWNKLGYASTFILTDVEFDQKKNNSSDTSYGKRYHKVTCNDGKDLYITNQWRIDGITEFIEKVNNQGWSITVEKITE